MTYSIVYISKTGNTALLAERINTALPQDRCIYCGKPAPLAAEADLIFAGFFTDKGTCSEELALFLNTLKQKKVFLFGTAGFGGATEYFKQILERVSTYLTTGNIVVGSYMCQGKMPLTLRARYEAMAAEQPGKANSMLENFDHALSHPDDKDLNQLEDLILELIKEDSEYVKDI